MGNPRREGKEHCKAITLRSGREVAVLRPLLEIVKEPKQSNRSEIEVDIEQNNGDQPQLNSSSGKQPEVEKLDQPISRDPTLLIPYPKRLRESKLDKQFKKFLNIFKKLQINIPFTNVLE